MKVQLIGLLYHTPKNCSYRIGYIMLGVDKSGETECGIKIVYMIQYMCATLPTHTCIDSRE